MSACCATEGQPAVVSPGACPLCGNRGVRVDPITLKALLVPEALRRGIPPAPRFCATRECAIVYFDSAAGVTFFESDVSVPVYAKRAEDADVPVCYCFGVSQRTIREEANREHARSVSQRIRDEVTAGHCACEVRNPKGVCCLGDVIAAEKMASF
jgi:hypothetical protein